MRLIIVVFVLLTGLFSGVANAQRACTAAMSSVECDAFLHGLDTGLKPAVEDMECVEFVQEKPPEGKKERVVLTFWKDEKRTKLVRKPITREFGTSTGTFKQGGWSFDQALEGWIDLCNGSKHSQRNKPFIQKARHSGQCIKMCLLGEAKCKELGYYDKF